MCRVLEVSTSAYYKWKAREETRNYFYKVEQKLVDFIKVIHSGSKHRYGSPMIHDRLRGLGYDLSESTVARRMRKHGIRSKLKRKFKVTTESDHKLPVKPNLLMQDFSAYAPNQIWMSDITYVNTSEGWLYVCGVIDLYSKKIVAWTASSRMTTDLVASAYLSARQKRKPNKHLIFHSDRGCQYASKKFTELLSRHHVLQSMSRRANCWDSAPIESFWARLKTECVYWENFTTRHHALLSIREWIEDEYNTTRPHSSLGYATPSEMEKQFKLVSNQNSV
jgi:transposase InsO family protein